jgi:hypothetical protein
VTVALFCVARVALQRAIGWPELDELDDELEELDEVELEELDELELDVEDEELLELLDVGLPELELELLEEVLPGPLQANKKQDTPVSNRVRII